MGWMHNAKEELQRQIDVSACELGCSLANEFKSDDEYQSNSALQTAAKTKADEYKTARQEYEKKYGCRGPACTLVSRFVSGWYATRNMQRAQLGYGAGFSPLLGMGSGRMGPTRGFEFG